MIERDCIVLQGGVLKASATIDAAGAVTVRDIDAPVKRYAPPLDRVSIWNAIAAACFNIQPGEQINVSCRQRDNHNPQMITWVYHFPGEYAAGIMDNWIMGGELPLGGYGDE